MIKILSIVITSSILMIVIELIRQEKLTFKYAFGWIIVYLFGIIFVVFDQLLFKAASLSGFELPSNFVFFVMMVAFVFLSLLMTIFLCQQNSRNDLMAQKIGMLELELEKLKNKAMEKNKS